MALKINYRMDHPTSSELPILLSDYSLAKFLDIFCFVSMVTMVSCGICYPQLSPHFYRREIVGIHS